jgi:hypothetical protein
MEITQMNRTIQHMQNELTRLRRDENFVPTNQNPRIPAQAKKNSYPGAQE